LAKEEVLHDVWKVISLVSFYLCHVNLCFCVMSVPSIYVMWTNCVSMSCGQIIFLCHVHKLLTFHVDKLFIYIMYTNYCSYLAMMMMTLMKRMRIFLKMIYDGSMLGQTYVDMFVKKILQGRLQQVEWGICWSYSTLQENAIGNCA
jgi:hypothetical protein